MESLQTPTTRPDAGSAWTAGATGFAALCQGARERRAPALARLSALVVQLLAARLSGRASDERVDICRRVLERALAQLSDGPLSDPAALLDCIEREAARVLEAASPTSEGWLARLARALPELDTPERKVLEGLYLEGQSPVEIAERLDLSLLDLHEVRRRGLHALRSRLDLR